jgi:ferritin-like metal-binding protein YciE
MQKSDSRKSTAATKGKQPEDKNVDGEKSEFRNFFIDELKDIYWAEKHLLKVLPKMQKAATSDELIKAFADHLEATKGHVSKLEQVFQKLKEKPQAKKCDAMEGLAKEGEGIIEDTEAGTMIRDAGLILAAQKVEHYEIATYGGLAQIARTIGEDEVADLLEENLQEEKEADQLLTAIAEGFINAEATQE